MEKKLKLSKKTKVISTICIICVGEVIDGVSQTPKAFYGKNEKKVVEAAEKHFAALLKEENPPLADGSTFDDLLRECLDNGSYDSMNGYEIILSWPTREEVK